VCLCVCVCVYVSHLSCVLPIALQVNPTLTYRLPGFFNCDTLQIEEKDRCAVVNGVCVCVCVCVYCARLLLSRLTFCCVCCENTIHTHTHSHKYYLFVNNNDHNNNNNNNNNTTTNNNNNTHNNNIIIKIEPIYVQLDLTNPLHVQITVTNIQLLCNCVHISKKNNKHLSTTHTHTHTHKLFTVSKAKTLKFSPKRSKRVSDI